MFGGGGCSAIKANSLPQVVVRGGAGRRPDMVGWMAMHLEPSSREALACVGTAD